MQAWVTTPPPAANRTDPLRSGERVLGPDHVFVALALTELGGVFLSQGAPEEALPVLQRALAIREKRQGRNHRDVARTLTDLAATYLRMDERALAQELAARAVAIWEQTPSSDPDFAATLDLYGKLQVARSDARAARTYLERALAIQTRVLGPAHPTHADTQASLAVALAMLGESDAAIQNAKAAEDTGREHLRLMTRSLPERQSLNYATSRPKALDLMLSLVTTPSSASTAFDALISSRALVLDEMMSRAHPAPSASAELPELRASLVSAQNRLAALVVRGPEAQAPDRYAIQIEEARRTKEQAERALAQRSAKFSAELWNERASLSDIRRAMPPRSALVSYVRYTHTVFARGSATSRPSYLAFIVRPEGQPVVVQLGDAGSIDALVVQWRSEVSAAPVKLDRTKPPSDALRMSGAALRAAIWHSALSTSRGQSNCVHRSGRRIELGVF